MSDDAKTPQFTEEQLADVRHLSAFALANSDTALGPRLARVLALLPSDLTDPQPLLPTEPGTTIYGGRDQPRTMFRLDYGSSPRHWIDQYGERRTDAEARDLMGEWEETPPTVERPQITREEIQEILRDYHADQEAGLVHRLLLLLNGDSYE